MKPDHLEAWQDYLSEEIHARYGVDKHEAHKTAARWLQSVAQRLGGGAGYRKTPAKPSEKRTRAAHPAVL